MSRMSNPPKPDFKIHFTSSAERDMERIGKSDRKSLARIDAKIDSLGSEPRPHGMDKIEGEINVYRIRSGDYRIVYSIDDNAGPVTIEVIGNRRDVYRRF